MSRNRNIRKKHPATEIASEYGRHHRLRLGIIAEHLSLIEGHSIRVPAHGRPLVVDDATGRAFALLCGELVEQPTEEGIVAVRCGLRVENENDFACPAHAEDRNRWRNMSAGEQRQYEERL